jgi:xanthine dehydrogenase accessory factor
VKLWHETRQVLDWISTLRVEHRRSAIATVVSVRGSAYRREGAKMAVAEDGSSVGNVSGGCLELDVREVALEVIASGIPQLRNYCSTSDEVHAWDLGIGCEGEVKVFVEQACSDYGTEQTLLGAGVPFAVCTVINTSPTSGQRRLVVTATGCDGEIDRLAVDPAVVAQARDMLGARSPSALQEFAGHEVFIDVCLPPPQLVIISAGNDARPLARIAVEVGFQTVVVDRRPDLLRRDRFPEAVRLIESSAADLASHVDFDAETCAVVMTHNFADDEHYLRALVTTPARYIGVLGPRQRTERLVDGVAADTPFDTDRIYGPVGLDVGTDGAEQVALSVVAELLAVRGGRRLQSLRDRETPIHLPHLA